MFSICPKAPFRTVKSVPQQQVCPQTQTLINPTSKGLIASACNLFGCTAPPTAFFPEFCADDPNYCATASMDAVLKCGRFANVRNAARHLQPHRTEYLGVVEKQVEELAERGRCAHMESLRWF